MSLADYIRRVNAIDCKIAEVRSEERSGRKRARVFVSYPRATPAVKDALVAVLDGLGYQVVHDGQIPGGCDYARWIEDAIDGADAVVVVWNDASVTSAWVRAEAMRADAQAKLVPIAPRDFDHARLPLPFARLNTICCDDAAGLATAITALLATNTPRRLATRH